MAALTVRDLRALKGVRQICFVQITSEEQALAAQVRHLSGVLTIREAHEAVG
jgi:hypothetical protein